MNSYIEIDFMFQGSRVGDPLTINEIDENGWFGGLATVLGTILGTAVAAFTGGWAAVIPAVVGIGRTLQGSQTVFTRETSLHFPRGSAYHHAPVDEVQVWFRAWSDDLTDQDVGFAVHPDAAAPIRDLGHRFYSHGDDKISEIGFSIPWATIPVGPIGFLFAAKDDGWFYDYGVVNSLWMWIDPSGMQANRWQADLFAKHSVHMALYGDLGDPGSNSRDYMTHFNWALGRIVESEPGAIGLVDVLANKVRTLDGQYDNTNWVVVYSLLSNALANDVNFFHSGRDSTDFNVHFQWASDRIARNDRAMVTQELIDKYSYALTDPRAPEPKIPIGRMVDTLPASEIAEKLREANLPTGGIFPKTWKSTPARKKMTWEEAHSLPFKGAVD